jgi:hypothetical protein
VSGLPGMELGKSFYYGGLRALGVTALRRRSVDAALILCYHNVVAPGDTAVGGAGIHLARDRFEGQMRWLAERYTVVSLREMAERLEAGKPLR